MDKYHTAEYFRLRRAKLRHEAGKPEMDAIPAEVFERGRELKIMMELPPLDWPADLFAAGMKLDIPRTSAKYVDPMKCPCGKPHNNAVSKVVGERPNWRVLWFCCSTCKSKGA